MADFPKKPKKVGNSGKVWSKGHFLERFDVTSLGGVQQDMRGQYGPRIQDTVDKANQLLDDFSNS
mgnify:CR=1 FL=1